MSVTAKKFSSVGICPGAFSTENFYYDELGMGAVIFETENYAIEFIPYYNNTSDVTNFYYYEQNMFGVYSNYSGPHSTINRFRVYDKNNGKYVDYPLSSFMQKIMNNGMSESFFKGFNLYALENDKIVIFAIYHNSSTYYQTLYSMVGTINANLSITWGTVYTIQNNSFNVSNGLTMKMCLAAHQVGNLFVIPLIQYVASSTTATSWTITNSLLVYKITGTSVALLSTVSIPSQGSSGKSITSNDAAFRNILRITDNKAHLFVTDYSGTSEYYSIYELTSSENELTKSTIYSPDTSKGSYTYSPFGYSGDKICLQPLWICGKSIINKRSTPVMYNENTYTTSSCQSGSLGSMSSANTGTSSCSFFEHKLDGIQLNSNGIYKISGTQFIRCKQKLMFKMNANTVTQSSSPEYYNSYIHRALYGFESWLAVMEEDYKYNDSITNYSRKYVHFPFSETSDGTIICNGYCEDNELVTGETGKTKQITSILVSSKNHGPDTMLTFKSGSTELFSVKIDDIPCGILDLSHHPIIVSSDETIYVQASFGYGDVTVTAYGLEETV